MKTFCSKLLSSLFLILFTSVILFSQSNSVELRDSSGTLVASFSDITTAYAAIPATVAGPYLIEILPAYDGSTETFPIQLGLKNGTSLTNTITIRPKAGNTGEIISGNLNNPAIILDDADFVIIDGRPGGVGNQIDLKIQNLSTSTSAHTIRLINGATHNKFQYLHLYGASASTAGPRNFDFSTSASNPTGNSDNLIQFCKLEGSRSGIGFAGTTANPNANNVVQNCKIFNWGYAGIWLSSNVLNFTLEECEVYHTVGVSNTLVSGVISSTSTNGIVNIKKNKFYDFLSTATTATSVRALNFTPATGSTLNIENNFFSLTKDLANVSLYHGIHILGSNAHTSNIYFNSIRIGGIHTGGTSGAVVSSGIFKANSNTATIFNSKNNICINTRTGGTGVYHVGNMISNVDGVLDINYNAYYSSGSANNFAAGWGTTLYNVLADYQAAATPHETNTKFKDVNFVSTTDLHLTGSSIGDSDLFGTPIAGILTDIDNEPRSATSPYKGGDEPMTSTVPIGWCNLQWPGSGNINQGGNFDVYAQIWIDSVTPGPGQAPGVLSWIGYNTTNTNPNTWTNWIAATYNSAGPTGNNDEYMANIGPSLAPGTYFYASRFQYLGGAYKYGGYSAGGGGFWDGSTYNSGTLTIASTAINVTFNTNPNWNIVSVPVTTTQTNKDSLFIGNVSAAYWFDGSSYVTQTSLTGGKGYWLKFDSLKSHTINGMAVPGRDINVISGWNMIGTHHLNVAASLVTTNPPGIIASSFYGFDNGYFVPTTLDKGKGYWVKTSSTGILTIPIPVAKSTPQEAYSETIDPKWAMITITDSKGGIKTIYLGDGIASDKYELPPIPPAGIFDARFASQKYVESSGLLQQININSVNYPIEILFSNVSGRELRITDGIGGSIDRKIYEGDRIVISNPAISTLNISSTSFPISFGLMQNYPNPFNPSTVICYQLSEGSHVSLKVYDILGREVATLVDEVKEAGVYNYPFSTINYPLNSGVYFYKLQAGKFIDIKKMQLIK
ncbi:MAG: T9SS type A sorting domain-containing protein [Ignavibacteria bacterium]|nr:T9SS type A sorting domain-containing protein [Ignavibacteria bacterium]